MKNKKRNILNSKLMLSAIAGVSGFCGLCRLMNDSGFRSVYSWSMFSLVLFILILFLENNLVELAIKDGKESKKIFRYAYVYGVFFGAALDMGYQFQVSEMTSPGIRGKLGIIITGLLLSAFFLPITYRMFRFAAGMYSFGARANVSHNKGFKCFIISWAIIQISWFPAFLAYYPAIMSYDFHRQFGEAVKGYVWFYEYQPLVHTFLIRQAYLLGTGLGNVAAGMAIFVFVQSMILNAAISLVITYVYKRTGFKCAAACCALFALLPFNPVLAISITKDILFSAFFALFLLSFLLYTKKDCTLYAVFILLSGILNILFRNNAVYALVCLVPAILLCMQGAKKKLVTAALIVITIISGMGIKTGIRTTMNAISGNRIEMFSVPIVQMVRVVKNQENNLTPEQENILHNYISDESWGTYYVSIADSPKAIASRDRNAQWLDNPKQLLKDYISIGMAYPNDYLDAWIGLTTGYWFVDDRSHAEMLGFGDDTDMGLLYTFNASVNGDYPEGIESHSYLPGLEGIYSHIVNGNSYYNWPVFSQLMKPAFYFWLLVFACFICVFKRSKKSILILAYPVMYFMTMLLGPCVNFRYMYPIIVIIPVLLTFTLSEKEASGNIE